MSCWFSDDSSLEALRDRVKAFRLWLGFSAPSDGNPHDFQSLLCAAILQWKVDALWWCGT